MAALPPHHQRHPGNATSDKENGKTTSLSESDLEIKIRCSMSPDTIYKVTSNSTIVTSSSSRALQSKAHRAQERVQKAKRKLADATNATEWARKKLKPLERLSNEMDKLFLVAKKFTIMKLFWLWGDKQTFQTDLDKQYDTLQHFESLESKIQGQVADIKEKLPAAYVNLMSSGKTAWLSQKVCLTSIHYTCLVWI